MILIPTPSHTEQISNAKQAEKLGIARVIQQEELSKERLLKEVKQVLNDGAPARLKRIQKEVLTHDGLKNIANAIIELAEK